MKLTWKNLREIKVSPRLIPLALLLALGSAVAPAHAAPRVTTDLSVSGALSSSDLSVGTAASITWTVSNVGKRDASTVVLTGQLPSNISRGAVTPGCKVTSKGAFTCRASRVAKGASTFWAFNFTPSKAGRATFSGAVAFSGTDSKPRNNRSSLSATVAAVRQNRAPSASPLTLNVNPSVPYFETQLTASDPDNDIIFYELVSAASGSTYKKATINRSTGKLSFTVKPGSEGVQDSILFRVSDGQRYSEPATVSFTVRVVSNKNTGSTDTDARSYSGFDKATYDGDVFGKPGQDAALPTAIDLSPNFPIPGNQGQQGSCVGWATTYALKSFQERLEVGWDLNDRSHLFSPAYVYNQINGGRDQGSKINEALQLIVDQGAATFATAPYDDSDFTTQPSSTARAEASQFKALKWATVGSVDDVKAALANRRPVTMGVQVYDQFQSLRGASSVYNSTAGTLQGGHALTIVGYDDSRFGGAFKVINSWGTGWGDAGFFWLPYAFFPKVVKYAYVLEDKPNTNTPVSPTPTPSPENPLPNLSVQSWSTNYDPIIGGTGALEYTVVNSGQGTLPAGADVSLVLSKDDKINANDTLVVYEKIPFDLEPGDAVYRSFDEGNSIEYQFPDSIPAGDYYLALRVDNDNLVEESDETDNVSLSDGTISLVETKADLSVDSWYASWDDEGSGALTYQINNEGVAASPAGWHIGLFLTTSTNLAPGTFAQLLDDVVPFTIDGGGSVYRDDSSAAPFDLTKDVDGNNIPSGTYFMLLSADTTGVVNEGSERNNDSWSWGVIDLGMGRKSERLSPKSGPVNQSLLSPTSQAGQAYNGRNIKPQVLAMKRVRLKNLPNGKRSLEVLAPDVNKGVVGQKEPTKHLSAKSPGIFPVESARAMP